jgi:hypothetical protein
MQRNYSNSELAPIALFVYNRPRHTQQTVEFLQGNAFAQQSDLFVFSDAAKNHGAAAAVQEVRHYVRRIYGFQSVTVIERETNFGLAKSVIAGVTQLCNDYGRTIAIEDDVLTASDFLAFMNRAFEQYKSEPRVFSISGYNFGVNVPTHYTYDAFCAYRSSSWGWGTWKDRWAKADWAVSDYLEFRTDTTRQRLFNRGGEDLSHMLDLQMAGKVDSWAIRWAYSHFKHGACALLPTASKVYNIGLDGSGVHCHRGSARQTSLTPGSNGEYRFPDLVELDPYFVSEIQRTCRASLPRKVARYFRDKLRSKGLIW